MYTPRRYKCDTSKLMAPVLMKRGASINIANHEGCAVVARFSFAGDIATSTHRQASLKRGTWEAGHNIAVLKSVNIGAISQY